MEETFKLLHETSGLDFLFLFFIRLHQKEQDKKRTKRSYVMYYLVVFSNNNSIIVFILIVVLIVARPRMSHVFMVSIFSRVWIDLVWLPIVLFSWSIIIIIIVISSNSWTRENGYFPIAVRA